MDTKVTNSKKKKPKTIHIDHRRMKHINEENILKCILISQILQHCPTLQLNQQTQRLICHTNKKGASFSSCTFLIHRSALITHTWTHRVQNHTSSCLFNIFFSLLNLFFPILFFFMRGFIFVAFFFSNFFPSGLAALDALLWSLFFTAAFTVCASSLATFALFGPAAGGDSLRLDLTFVFLLFSLAGVPLVWAVPAWPETVFLVLTPLVSADSTAVVSSDASVTSSSTFGTETLELVGDKQMEKKTKKRNQHIQLSGVTFVWRRGRNDIGELFQFSHKKPVHVVRMRIKSPSQLQRRMEPAFPESTRWKK